MGVIKKILVEKEIPTPQFNQRLTVELCENVHLHYRNLRLEFSKEEFVELVKHLREINLDYVSVFPYSHATFEIVAATNQLPECTEHNRRLQIEEQENGTFHVHYRNLRIEVDSLSEVGIETKAT